MQFFIKRLQLFFKVFVADFFARCYANIAPGVERPALRFYFSQRGGFAQAERVGIGGGGGAIGGKDFVDFGLGFFAALGKVGRFATVKAHDVGDKADLCGAPVAVGAVYLAVDVACVDKQHGVGAVCFCLAFVKKPQRARQGDGVKHIGANGNHHIYGACCDELLAQFLLAGAGIRCRVGHDKACPPTGIEGGVKKLYPQVVGIVGARQAKGEAAACAHHVFEALFIYGIDVKRRVGQNKVKPPGGVVRVVVIAVDVVAVFDFAFEPMHGEVEAAQAAGFVGFFYATDGEFISGVALVLGDKACRLHKHAARAAGGVEHVAVEGFDDFGEQLDDGCGGVKLAAALAFAHGECAQKVFVNAAKGVKVERGGDFGDFFEQLFEQGAGKEVVGFGQHACKLRVVALNIAHGGIDARAYVCHFGQVEQVIKPRLGGKVERACGMVGGGLVHTAAAPR